MAAFGSMPVIGPNDFVAGEYTRRWESSGEEGGVVSAAERLWLTEVVCGGAGWLWEGGK